jgi:cellulose synthase/poly-beta-1,6-N-acetylglucosamine synthase-like glycosyltransferase
MSVVVCALTYQRPDGLHRLLEGLQRLVFTGPPPEIRFVIVDNDPAGSGHALCEEFATRLRGPLQYVVEPQPGIAPARNAALHNAADAEWICFIDDDEVPEPQWLAELLRVQREYQADVVAGPVLSHFPDRIPKWVLEGRFFDRRRYPTGHRLKHAFTGNVLFRRRILEDLQLRFDPRWAFTGGEDRHFFQRIALAGYRIVWADEAVATEWVPSERATAAWLIRRRYRAGNATSLIERDLRPIWRVLPVQLGKGLTWWIIGLGLLVTSPLRGKAVAIRALRSFSYGAGLLTGLVGISYHEYRRESGV